MTARELPFVDFSTVGPAVGTVFPDITLPDQHGEVRSLSQRRAGRRALVVIYRSAGW